MANENELSNEEKEYTIKKLFELENTQLALRVQEGYANLELIRKLQDSIKQEGK